MLVKLDASRLREDHAFVVRGLHHQAFHTRLAHNNVKFKVLHNLGDSFLKRDPLGGARLVRVRIVEEQLIGDVIRGVNHSKVPDELFRVVASPDRVSLKVHCHEHIEQKVGDSAAALAQFARPQEPVPILLHPALDKKEGLFLLLLLFRGDPLLANARPGLCRLRGSKRQLVVFVVTIVQLSILDDATDLVIRRVGTGAAL